MSLRPLCLALAVLAAAPAQAERTFGLVIGIDDYTYVPDLHGAVNDARDIADALTAIGAEVTLLTDAEATRDAILGNWRGILARAQPGDRLIVTYAGHGSNEPEHTPGSEADGRDENFLLAGFAPRGEAAGQRIRDDEIADLLEQSAALEVIFVADACHSGTVTRNLNPELGYRYVSSQTLSADPLPPPPPPPPSGSEAGQVALFLAAVNEAEKVPEVLIDGEARGALSYAFADGLRGAADLDRDGRLTKGELETHVRRTVRQVSDGVQLPQSEPAGFENRALLALPETAPAPAPEIPLRDRAFADLPPIQVSARSDWTGIQGIAPAETGLLRREGATLFSAVGDPVGLAADRTTLQAAVDKHRLAETLDRLSFPALAVAFDQGDRTYSEGEALAIAVEGRTSPFLTLFNIGADGTITLLYPVASMDDPSSLPPAVPLDLPVRIAAPFGADHVVAVETDTPALALRTDLARLSGSRDMAALWDTLRRTEGRIALFPFFTKGKSW